MIGIKQTVFLIAGGLIIYYFFNSVFACFALWLVFLLCYKLTIKAYL